MKTHRYRLSGRFRHLAVCVVLLAGIVPVPANAWTPAYQLHLADLALNDALDGRIDLYEIDYDAGEFRLDAQGNRIRIGSYPVHPEILNALRSFPDQFRAGVLGAMAFPDIMTGQELIHARLLMRPNDPTQPEPNTPATREWLQHLWERAFYSDNPDDTTPAAKAFVVGYLVYAGGEMYAGALANGAVGAAGAEGWEISRRAMEQYILSRSQPLPDWKVSIDGIEGFLYRSMIDTRAGSLLDQRGLYRGPGAEETIPWIYSRLRDRITEDIKSYYAALARYDRLIREKQEAAKRCSIWDFSCSRTILLTQAILIATERAAYTALNGIPNAYRERWIQDIDYGLQALPGTSLRIAQDLFFSRDPNTHLYGAANLTAVRASIESYRNRHLYSMAGLPDFVGMTIELIRLVTEKAMGSASKIASMVGSLASNAAGFENNIGGGFGMPLARLRDLMASPAQDLSGALVAHGTSLQEFDQKTLHLTTDQHLEDERFAPACNTIAISKLIFLGRNAVNDLLTDLAAPRPAPVLTEDNIALGFIESLDGGDQWYLNPRKMVLAADCLSYRRLFMRLEGEDMPCQDAVLRVEPSSATLYAGESQPFRIAPSVPATWTLEGDGAIDLEGRFTAPGAIEGDRLATVRVKATDGTNREATASVTLKAPDYLFRPGDVTGMPGNTVRVPLLVNGLANIRSATIRLHYDGAVLDPVIRVNSPWVDLMGETRGTIFARDLFPDPSLEITLSDMGVRQEGLVEVLFRIRDNAPSGPSPIRLDVSDVARQDLVSGAVTPVPFGRYGIGPGSVTVGLPSSIEPQILFRAGEAAGQPGTSVRVPVFLEGGEEVDSATVTLTYDDTVLEPVQQGALRSVMFRGATTGFLSYQEQARSIQASFDNILLREEGLLDFVFRIKEGAKLGRTPLQLTVAKVLKSSNEPIAPDLYATEEGGVDIGVPNPTPPILVTAGQVYGKAGDVVSVPLRITGIPPDSLHAIRLSIGFVPAFMLPARNGLAPDVRFVGLTTGAMIAREKAMSIEVEIDDILLREDGLVEAKFQLSDRASGTSPVKVEVLSLIDESNYPLAPDLYAGRAGSVTVGTAPITDEGFALTLSSAAGDPGEVVQLVVAATKDAQSVAGAKLTLDFSATPPGQPALEVLSDKITPDGLFPSVALAVDTPAPGRITLGMASDQVVNGPGPLVRIPVRIPEDAASGTVYGVTLQGSLSDGVQDREVPARGGSLTVRKLVMAAGSGDVTGDGQVTVTDAVLLLRAIAGRVTLTLEARAAGDVAPKPGTEGRAVGDGAVNVADVIRILRISIGMDRPVAQANGSG